MNMGDLSAPPTFLVHISISYTKHLVWYMMSCVTHDSWFWDILALQTWKWGRNLAIVVLKLAINIDI